MRKVNGPEGVGTAVGVCHKAEEVSWGAGVSVPGATPEAVGGAGVTEAQGMKMPWQAVRKKSKKIKIRGKRFMG
jgi:hypothetical protein